MDRYKYLRIEYPEEGCLQVVHQRQECYEHDSFVADNGLKISSCDLPEVRLREQVLFIRGMDEDSNERISNFISGWNLENIVKINEAVLEYNKHLKEMED